MRAHFRWVFRFWRRRPLISGLLIAVVAIGIGSAASVFSVVDGVLLRPLPFSAENELVEVDEHRVDPGFDSRTSGITLRDWRAGTDVLNGLTAFTEGALDYSAPQGPLRIQSASVDGGFFDVLGVPVLHGRPLRRADDTPGATPVAVIGYDLWRTTFGADPTVVGRTVRFGQASVRIVGIARPDFDYPGGVAAWVPLSADPGWEVASTIRGARFVQAIGRLRDGVGPAAAAARLSAIMRAEPDLEGWTASVTPLRDSLVGTVRTPLWILLAAVLLLLTIAAVNISTVLMAETRVRAREMSIRRTLGARPRRLVGQLLGETIFIIALGGVLGTVGAVWGVEILASLSPRELPETAKLAFDVRVVGFAMLLVLATALAAVFGPLLLARGVPAARVLGGGRSTSQGSPVNTRAWNALVIGEVAMTAILLVGAGLLVRSFARVVTVDTGLDANHVITFHLTLPDYRYATPESAADFQTRLLEGTGGLAGVQSVALARNLPLAGSSMSAPVVLEEEPPEAAPSTSQFTSVTPGYFETLGIHLVAGRTFLPSDDADGDPVAVVSESFANAYFPGRPAIGQRARTLFGPPVLREIVGVVADVRHAGPRQAAPPMYYAPHAQMSTRFFFLTVRADLPREAVVAGVRRVVGELDPELPLADIAGLDDLLSEAVAEPRFYATALSYFAMVALLLSTLGLFGLLVQRITARRREIGIRMAVGARPAHAVRLVVGHAILLVATGTAAGLTLAFAGSRVLHSLLYETAATDPLTYLGVGLVLVLAGALACWVPAQRAARVDPAVSLQE